MTYRVLGRVIESLKCKAEYAGTCTAEKKGRRMSLYRCLVSGGSHRDASVLKRGGVERICLRTEPELVVA